MVPWYWPVLTLLAGGLIGYGAAVFTFFAMRFKRR